VLDSPPKPGTFSDFSEDEAGPKKGPDNPEKPDRAWSVKKKL
jgi:hypothetical protein